MVELARQRRLLAQSGQFIERVDQLTAEIRAAVAPFARRDGLALEADAGGGYRLSVRVASDVEDAAFLEAFAEAIAREWTRAEAARELGLRIELELKAVTPGELYPEGPPARGRRLELADHLGRFPEGYMVLTTGAESVHSGNGYVQLGPAPITPRVLAHEFGHLLGFADGYLRGYEGRPGDPYGVRVVEWTGLLEDLMGAPAFGRVTRGMIEQLLEVYGPAR